MIQGELQQGNAAGQEHYRRAGEMLIEAKEQVGHGGWSKWLTKNFDLSQRTASDYMRWAREHDQIGTGGAKVSSLREMRGATDRDREDRQSKQQQAFRRVLRDVARDDFVQERQARGVDHRTVDHDVGENSPRASENANRANAAILQGAENSALTFSGERAAHER